MIIFYRNTECLIAKGVRSLIEELMNGMRKTSIKDLGKKWFAFSKLEDFKPEELVARIYE